ncbi:MAG: hypothetical protein K6357_02400 [Elusimicrobiota bacterium]
MKHVLKIKNREIVLDVKDLTPIEISEIESKIANEFEKLEEQKIIDTITQFTTIIAKYAVENYIREKENKIKNEHISLKIDSLTKYLKETIQKETLF